MRFDTVIRNGDLVDPHAGVLPVDIAISDGRIAALLARGTEVDAAEKVDATGLTVFTGLIDPHVHQNITSSDDPWLTETRSAALGGVTSLIDFRMAKGPFSEVFADHLASAAGSSYIDFGFQFIMMLESQLAEIGRYPAEFGVSSFKMLMSFKGREGAYLGADGTDDGFLFLLMERIAAMEHGMLSLHTENVEVIWRLRDRLVASGRTDLAAFTESRPPCVEAEDIHKAIHYGHVTGCPVHIVHLTSAEGYRAIVDGRRQYPGVRVTVETCPHYLTHTCESEVGVLARVNPPVKYAQDREALWAALIAGGIDTIGSDHCSRNLKDKLSDGGGKDVWKTQSAFPGIGTILPILLSEGYHKRGMPLSRIAEVTSCNTARLYGLWPRKGAPKPGWDADFALVDLEAVHEVTPERVASVCDWNIWNGWKLKGWPVATMIRGQFVMRDGEMTGAPGYGQYLARPVARQDGSKSRAKDPVA